MASFPLFPKFPLEVREMIWLAVDRSPLVITIEAKAFSGWLAKYMKDSQHVEYNGEVSALLSVNTESRKVIFRHQRAVLPGLPRFYDPTADLLAFPTMADFEDYPRVLRYFVEEAARKQAEEEKGKPEELEESEEEKKLGGLERGDKTKLMGLNLKKEYRYVMLRDERRDLWAFASDLVEWEGLWMAWAIRARLNPFGPAVQTAQEQEEVLAAWKGKGLVGDLNLCNERGLMSIIMRWAR